MYPMKFIPLMIGGSHSRLMRAKVYENQVIKALIYRSGKGIVNMIFAEVTFRCITPSLEIRVKVGIEHAKFVTVNPEEATITKSKKY